MKEIGSTILHDLFGDDREVLDEFRGEVQEYRESFERMVALLGRDPANGEYLARLAEIVGAIKTGALMLHIPQVIDLAGAVERLCGELRAERMPFTQALGEALLLAVDMVRDIGDSLARGESLEHYRLDGVLVWLHRLGEAPAVEVAAVARQMVDQVVGERLSEVRLPECTLSEGPVAAEGSPDLEFFRSFTVWMENRSCYWQGRGARLHELAAAMNEAAGLPVDPAQLEAAVLLHDYGMAMLPETVLHKAGKLNPLELKLMRQHPWVGAGFLGRMAGWEGAARIVAEHHERPDGGGYPKGLRYEEICPGARILAILDAFDAMTNERSNRLYKRSVLRAVNQIHSGRGSQFCPEWVDRFIGVAKARYKEMQ